MPEVAALWSRRPWLPSCRGPAGCLRRMTGRHQVAADGPEPGTRQASDGPEPGTHQASSWIPVLLGIGAVGGLAAVVAGIALAAAPPPATPVLFNASNTSQPASGTPLPSGSPLPSSSVTPLATPSALPTPTISTSPTPSPSASSSPTPTPTPTATPTGTYTATPTPTTG